MSRELFRNYGKICYKTYSNDLSNECSNGGMHVEGEASQPSVAIAGFSLEQLRPKLFPERLLQRKSGRGRFAIFLSAGQALR